MITRYVKKTLSPPKPFQDLHLTDSFTPSPQTIICLDFWPCMVISFYRITW